MDKIKLDSFAKWVLYFLGSIIFSPLTGVYNTIEFFLMKRAGARKNKAEPPYALQKAARLFHSETRGFPPPLCGGVGFIVL